MIAAVEINQLIGALIAVTGAMLILGVSSMVAKHLGKYIDDRRQAKKGVQEPDIIEEQPESDQHKDSDDSSNELK